MTAGNKAVSKNWINSKKKISLALKRMKRMHSDVAYVMENVFFDFEIYRAIRDGDPEEFVQKLECVCKKEKLSSPQILDQATHGGDTMLHVAAKYGCGKIAELLASHYPDLLEAVTIKGNIALHNAARYAAQDGSDVIKVILSQHDAWQEKKVEYITRSKNRVGNTALHEAVNSGYLDGVIELFHKDKAVTHQLNNVNKSPLCIAVYNYMRCNDIVKPSQQEQKNRNAKEIVDCLLQDSLLENKPNAKWSRGQSPLHAAIEAVSDKRREQSFASIIVDRLLRCKIFDFVRTTTETASSSKARLEELVRRRPEMIYMKDEDGRTPLHYAALSGYLDGVCIMLKSYPPAAFESDVYGDLPIHLACKSGDVDVVNKLLVEQKCPYVGGLLNQKSQNILHTAAVEGKHDIVKYILTHDGTVEDIELNRTDRDGNTPLHVASENMYPMVLFHLTRDDRIDLQRHNREGLKARDIVLKRSQWPRTYRELLSHAILSSAGARCTEKGLKEIKPIYDLNRMKDLVNTLMLVAILIATVTFAAGFTVPGSVYGSDDSPSQRGTAVLVNRTIFQIFMICNTLAMYSSTFASFVLLWAQRGDYHLASSSFDVAIHLVALALMGMSGAFVAATNLVVHNVAWLANLITAIGIISILVILAAYILFVFPLESHHPFLVPASNIFFRILIPFAGSYEKLTYEEKSKTSD